MSTPQTVRQQFSHHDISMNPARLPGPDQQRDIRLALISLFDRLSKNDLTAAGYKIALSTLARLLSQGRVTEAMPVDTVAHALRLHRNSVGAGYQALVEVGLIRRIVNPNRGAPTRTTLTGPALALLKCIDNGRLPQDGSYPLEATTDSPATAQSHDDSAERTPNAQAVPSLHTAVTHDVIAHDPIRVIDEDQITCDIPDAPPAPHQPREEASKQAKHFSPDTFAVLHQKLSKDVIYDVLQGRVRRKDINQDWGLTEQEIECLLSMSPKPEPRPATTKRAALPVHAVPTTAEPRLAKCLFDALPRLASALGDQRAATVIDEIAFSVTHKNLGHGDRLGGARAGISLAMQGKWNTPHGMSGDWRGAVLRGLTAAHNKQSEAQETVH